jgi:hypothetical protein
MATMSVSNPGSELMIWLAGLLGGLSGNLFDWRKSGLLENASSWTTNALLGWAAPRLLDWTTPNRTMGRLLGGTTDWLLGIPMPLSNARSC